VAHTLACAQVAAADWRGADLTLQPALARDPSDPDLLWLSARVDFAQQRTRRAASQLEHLLDVEAEFEGREEAIELLARIQAEQEGEDATAVW